MRFYFYGDTPLLLSFSFICAFKYNSLIFNALGVVGFRPRGKGRPRLCNSKVKSSIPITAVVAVENAVASVKPLFSLSNAGGVGVLGSGVLGSGVLGSVSKTAPNKSSGVPNRPIGICDKLLASQFLSLKISLVNT